MADIFSYEDMLKVLEKLTPEQRRDLFSKLEVMESGHTKDKDTEKKISKNKDGLLVSNGQIISCPACGSVHLIKHGSKNGTPRVRCKDCGKTTSLPDINLFYRSRLDEQQWREILRGMVENLSLNTIAANTGLSTTAVWNNTKKVKMLIHEIYGEQDTFTGIVESDECFLDMSFKGKKDPAFFIRKLGRMPRHHRNRAEKIEYLKKHGLYDEVAKDPERLEELLTGKNYLPGTNRDNVCVLTGTDRSGNLFVKPVCLGSIETYHIKKHFDGRFEPDAVMVTDCNNSYDWFAAERNLHHERVLASKHVNGPWNLARVNAVHSNLSAYWPEERQNLPATKYLDLGLTFFWWLQKHKDLSTYEKVEELLGYIKDQPYTARVADWRKRPLTLDTKGLIPPEV